MREWVNAVRNNRIRENSRYLATPGALAFSQVAGEVLRHLIPPIMLFKLGTRHRTEMVA